MLKIVGLLILDTVGQLILGQTRDFLLFRLMKDLIAAWAMQNGVWRTPHFHLSPTNDVQRPRSHSSGAELSTPTN